MNTERKREWAFVAAVVLVGVFILGKTVRFSWNSGAIEMTITKQNGGIANLDVFRKPAHMKKLHVRVIEFFPGRILENRQYGKLGYQTNIFLDFLTQMNVHEAGKYRMKVFSDDGFRLKIDGNTVCEHPNDRAYAATQCEIALTKGKHRFEMSYFQGGGPMGLKVTYRPLKGSKQYIFGQDSRWITFEKTGR